MNSTARETDNNFTPLRLLLALCVVLGHFQLLAGVTSPPWPFVYAGAAVDCFFVVSGYLVSYSFDRDGDLMRFYTRRFFRIYPLYIVVVAAQTAIFAALGPTDMTAAGDLLRYFLVNAAFANFLAYNPGHGVMSGLFNPSLNPSLWTLKIEFGFYLILPFLWRAVERWGIGLLAGIFILSAAYYWGFVAAGEGEYARQLPGQMQFFVLGIAAYRYRRHFVFSRTSGLILSAILSVCLTLLLRTHPPIIYPLIVGALVPSLALATPRIRLRADISYGVYLIHGPVIQLALVTGIYRRDWISLLAVLAAVIPIACLAERLVEAPGIRLGRRFGQGGRPREAVAIVAPRSPAGE